MVVIVGNLRSNQGALALCARLRVETFLQLIGPFDLRVESFGLVDLLECPAEVRRAQRPRVLDEFLRAGATLLRLCFGFFLLGLRTYISGFVRIIPEIWTAAVGDRGCREGACLLVVALGKCFPCFLEISLRPALPCAACLLGLPRIQLHDQRWRSRRGGLLGIGR